MPAGLIEQQDGVGARRDFGADRLQMLGHGVGVAVGHDEAGALALGRADRAEDIGPFRALVMWRAGPGPAPRPATRQLVLLTDPRFILEPDLDGWPAVVDADGGDHIAEVFLNSAMASSFWA